MDKTTRDDRMSVYEVSYLFAGVPEEKISGEAEALKALVTEAGASVIAEEMPHVEPLAYTMRKKTLAGSYDSYDSAYFGWIKFEIASNKIEALKKAIEVLPAVLRMLLITTTRENIYLGKRLVSENATARPAGVADSDTRPERVSIEGADVLSVAAGASDDNSSHKGAEKSGVQVAAASIEEMDKSIDEMVKEA